VTRNVFLEFGAWDLFGLWDLEFGISATPGAEQQ
jgi:hypothetical protein